MTLDEIHQTLLEAVNTGKVGTPVALRLHLQLVSTDVDPYLLVAELLQLCEPLFGEEPVRVMARNNNDGRQLNLLFETAAGRTISITIGGGSTTQAFLSLLLIGNHGVIRLEGADSFDEQSLNDMSDASAKRDHWHSMIASSLSDAHDKSRGIGF